LPASRAVARKLGFVDVGQQISVRLAAPGADPEARTV
jgi:hypothetical protein